ncbi:hypothetical protein P171DRAFT_509414 [Karstenula rhodostoma CBS 690.94]|uniref:N-acetyltransferase domain-containing protein n=1 Tax=Karstenula rhodostoma CBS 690.94 TaxID=1392251 RepID=A0A9P4PTI1_9PLEO|nr:hypothetical protein P171DRAFT_509414 [Karstenula rhodostoma CBS 690.94]
MPTYTTLPIPPSLPLHSLTPLAHKLRTFKLHALLSDPNAFSQDHATESLLPLSAWEARLTNPTSRIVVCVVDASEQERPQAGDEALGEEERAVHQLLHSTWAGTFTLVGPVPLSAWLFPLSNQPPPAADGAETRCHLTSLFVLPAHRGRGIAGKLTLAAVRAGSSGAAPAPTRFRLIVHPKNKGVVGLYEKLGFVKGGLYTQREAFVAMGDEGGIPVGAEGEKWDTRLAVGMEWVI